MIWLCQPMLDPVDLAEQIEHVDLPLGRRPQAVLWQVAKLNTVISEYSMDLVGDGLNQSLQESNCRVSVRPLMELGECKFRNAVDRNKQVMLTIFGANFSDIVVKK